MKRDTTQTIWRTVVFAGAMLGAPACSKQQPQTTTPNTAAKGVPSNTSAGGDPSMTPMKKPATGTSTADPCAGDANPCGGEPAPARPRGTDDDGGGGMGRGFVLS